MYVINIFSILTPYLRYLDVCKWAYTFFSSRSSHNFLNGELYHLKFRILFLFFIYSIIGILCHTFLDIINHSCGHFRPTKKKTGKYK